MTTTKVYSANELDAMQRDGAWIECSDALPPIGKEVVVEIANGKVTALARYLDYDGAPPERGRWDNRYPGNYSNNHAFESVVRWQPMPLPKKGKS